jgi:Protein of unknown function (DUF1161)
MHAHDPTPTSRSSRPVSAHLLALLLLAGGAAMQPAAAQIKKCENLRDEIASRLNWPKGSYRLEILPKEESTEGKFLGQCEAGSKKIVAFRNKGAAEAEAAAVDAATARVAPEPVRTARPTPSRPVATSPAAPAAVAPTPAAPEPVAAAPVAPAPVAPAPVAPTPVAPAPAAAPPVVVVEAKVEPAAPAAPAERTTESKPIEIKLLPERTPPGESVTLEVELDMDQVRKELANRGENIPADGQSPVRIVAKVSGSKLKVGPEDREALAVRPGQPTKWVFVLSPEDVGKQKVRIVLDVEQAKGAEPTRLLTVTRDLVVERSTWDEVMLFVNKNLQWLAATVLVPLAGLWWKGRKPAAA